MRVALLSLLLLCGCNAGPPSAAPGNGAATNQAVASPAAANASAASWYGTDGPETVDGRDYIPASTSMKWYADNGGFCFDQKPSQGCAYAQRAVTLRSDSVAVEGVYRERGGLVRVYTRQTLVLKGKYLCNTMTDRQIDALTAVNSTAQILGDSAYEMALSEADHAAWHQRLKRLQADQIGVERCYRFSVVDRDAKGHPTAMRQHEFVQGIEQPHDRIIVIPVTSEQYKAISLRAES